MMAAADYYRTNTQRRGVLGHISFGVRSYETSKQFYTAIFKPFGIELVFDDPVRKILGYGLDAQHEVFNVFERGEDARAPGAGTHLAFNAPNRAAVDGFFQAGIRNGGKGDGQPGIREKYGRDYYAAYLFDPDGFRLEAVFQDPDGEE
jgi:catechol 2,3-dioxygenase-like lactoylglutathione lyase family enzyme